jgi:hypothetical protein
MSPVAVALHGGPLLFPSRLVLPALLILVQVACSATSDDLAHDEDDAGHDATTSPADADDAFGRDAGALPEGPACDPACDTTQVCCVDAHGHFPTCRPGPACP